MSPSVINGSSSNDPHVRKRAFGLDNPDRVERILDHGQRLCYHDNTKARKIKFLGDVPDFEEFLSTLEEDLDNSMKKYFLDSNRYYVQRSDFERILTPEKVLQVVNKLSCYKSKARDEKRKLAEEICFGSKSNPPCIKVFGALLMSDQIQDIEIHRADGLCDHCLPLIFSEEGFRLSCDRHNKEHAGFNKKRSKFRKRFNDAARALVAPYIKWEDGKHFHYVIRDGSCLPIYDHKKIDKNDEGVQAVLDATNGAANGGYGGFSEVYRVKISKCHYNHSDTKGRHHRGYFALKKLTPRYTERESFNLELSTLIYSADQKGNKDHLIKLLATFEEHNSAQGQDRPTYYLLFDWAEGDLARYWKANERFVGDPKHCIWMSDQFCGLAEGLQIIHNDREENLKFLPANVSDPNVYGRHGDIKPGNILYFETGKSEAPDQSLVLADFGLGRLQTKYSRSKQDPRSLARTETYRSPEFDLPPPKGLVSPASDIFSLGCVFLEYISWYILGTKAVLEDFTNTRMAHDIYGFDVDIFFNVTTEPNGEQDAELKPSVKEWIQKLKKHRFCNDYINQMLDIIQDHMLDPNPKTRWRSMQLVKQLQVIKITCQRVPSFYTKNSNSSKSSHANTARNDPRNKEKPGSLTAYYQSKRGYRG
ncbi:unnamed protein product [Clonostachys chloroleuca]|uniref:Protein kinase domain-containing protein n=1 Tax=Clonostachys chloroleuca TaxID=1926264 RepID=A0AA35Q5T3_9HYPO|nr:unnamed protein product [Clonostachys chloroleuca]